MFKPRLSVITVVYNNVAHVEVTLLSVINQTYENIEYIIIDGLSTDGTLEVILRYRDRISKVIVEKDNGIYDAMNKGLQVATGDYVLFMNSGDEFYGLDTVERVFACEPNADIYYGETEMIGENGKSLGQRRHKAPAQFNWKGFKQGMSISHQAIYIRKALAEPYDLRYRLSGDIDWIIKAAKKAKLIINTNIYVARYRVGGISKKRHLESLKERFAILKKHYGLADTLFNHTIIAIKLGWYFLLNRKTND